MAAIPMSPGNFRCRKVSHPTYDTAMASLRATAEFDHPKRAERLKVYWCGQHASYHIGHGRKVVTQCTHTRRR